MSTQFKDEIDLILVLKKIYKSKKTIIYISFLFAFIGIYVALTTPLKYNSSTVFITQNENSAGMALTGVASLVGLNLNPNMNGSEITSSMYPLVAQSPKFKRLILQTIIDKKANLTLESFLIDNYKLKGENIKNNSSIYVSELEEDCFEIVSQIIKVSVNRKDGFITISTSMPIPEYAATLAVNAQDILQKIIIENKIESARQNLKFTENQLAQKKEQFDELQTKLSYFKDSNLNLVNSLIINEQDKLEAEFEIINAVVTELSKQVEAAKLQVNKDTPVFSTIKEAVIPNKRTSPKRTQMVIIFGIVGFVISIVYVTLFDPLKKLFFEIIK
tara:strand:+ start:591 stop:1583 length:993 start_codon:yes stop_codon:yes gene_type:complete